MRHSLEPDSREPDHDDVEPDDYSDFDFSGYEPPAEWLESEYLAHVTRELTRHRRTLRPVDLLRCPGDVRQLAAIYVYDGKLWLWHESHQETTEIRQRWEPPHAVPYRAEGRRQPAGWSTTVAVTCPGCKLPFAVTVDHTDRLTRTIDTDHPIFEV